MKRTLLLTAFIAALISNTANAQLGVSKITKKIVPKLTLGVKLGANVAQMDGNPSVNATYKPGIVGGAFVSVDKRKNGIRVEALIKSAKFDLSSTIGGSNSLRTVGLDIPALYEHIFAGRVRLQVGPQFSSIISAKYSNGVDAKNQLKAADISAVAGLEVSLPMKLTVGGRYIKGFLNVNNTASSDKWNNTSMQFYVGYRFLN